MRLPIIILVLASLAYAQKFRFSPVSETIVLQREQDAPATQEGRAAKVKQLFVQAGCNKNQISEQPLEQLAGVNVICRLPGKSNETIVVGANFNQTVPDNWTSAALLPSLFQTLAGRKRRHTFIFVAFADGSKDLAGAQFFAAHMSPTDVKHTEAMINLNPLGFSPTKISSRDSDKDLVKSFVTVVYALKQMASQVDLSKAAHMDSEPFATLHIPQITIHSLTQDAVADLQAQNEPLGVVNSGPDFAHLEGGFRSNLYYNSYHLLSGYLAFLDETLKPKHHDK